ncbi:DNA-binding protein [Pseudomonas abietaniphila]|uniref:Replication region DNA-binding N-term n=1 Tax=Pseudomonas abietaniphila TaxID=89065 RepID=A0A1G7VGC9_9PSED|nr:DNA-binding protein [Pseudomonas abietaniphila]SDG58794.1 replication region DNA-binding N-term [Pseudomonas abietaniphila]
MAVGVPESEVFAAADTVLARGERPTVERVRLELGRGSPARVGSLLDQWWDRLAQRLRSETRLPSLPSEVSQAFITIWQQAVRLAEDVAEQSLDDQRQVLVEERAKMLAIEDAARQEAAQYRQQAATAIAQQQLAERRLADLERLLEQGLRQIEDLTQQRDGLKDDRDAGRERIQSLERQLLSDRYDADQARKAQETYVRDVEARAHREVDRAREESKATGVQLKESAKQLVQLQKRLETTLQALDLLKSEQGAQKALSTQSARQLVEWEAKFAENCILLESAQHAATAQQARAETLEQMITHLRSQAQPTRRKRVTKPAAPEDT